MTPQLCISIVVMMVIKLISASPICFELPLVIVRPIEPLPTADCYKTQPSPPRPHCLRRSVPANIDVVDHGLGKMNCLNSTPTTQYIQAVIHARGDSSLYFPKRQYALKLRQEKSFLGLPPHKDWVLNGPFVDGSLLRNHLAHWLFRQTGRYSPRTLHFIMWLQNPEGTLEYQGIYVLLETISNGAHRLAIAKNNKYCDEHELNGGWVWQYSTLYYGRIAANLRISMYVNNFAGGARPLIQYPKGSDLTQSMRNYFVSEESGPIPRLYSYLWNNLSTTMDLEKHIDIGSFVDYMLHSEMSLNQDAYRKSLWFFKDRDQPINAGPVWDFNLAYGLGSHANSKDQWLYRKTQQWRRVLCNYKAAGLFIKRWKQLRSNEWSDDSIRKFLRDAANPLERTVAKCTGDWRSSGLHCANVNNETNFGSYPALVNALITATIDRAHWMDTNITTVYVRCNDSTCGHGASKSFPAFNCAQESSDSGCLETPERYFNSIEFPPIRRFFNGKQCEKPSQIPQNFEHPSFDACWFSAGTYLGISNITPFCSGYGICPGGPDATCHCLNNATTRDCSVVPEDMESTKTFGVIEKFTFLGVLVLTCMIIVVHISTTRSKPHPTEGSPIECETFIRSYGSTSYMK